MQDYGSLGITSIQDRKKLFQLVQSLRQQSIYHQSIVDQQDTDIMLSFSGIKTPQQQQLQQPQKSRMRLPLKNNMVGLSSVSYVKKSKDQTPTAIPTSVSSPRMTNINGSCRSPFPMRRQQQLPVFIRKQQEEQDKEEEEDDREVVKNNNGSFSALLNPYGLPTNRQIPSQTQQQASALAPFPTTMKKSDLNQKIRVCVRKRPLSKKELSKSEKDITPANGCRTIHVNEPKAKVDLTRYIEQHTFNFDDVFDIEDTNDYIYERTAQPLVRYIFEGGKATCFAYGQTGSGKTYTMMDSKHGLYILAAKDIFSMLQQPKYQHLNAWIGFYEIYQGQLYDLLAERKKLFAREDRKQNVVIVGLKEYLIKNVSDLMQVFEYGSQVRSTGSTNANSDSSRSHAIMQVLLKPNMTANGKKVTASSLVAPIGKLSFIDLAGSERGADRGETDLKTRMEGAEINKSLLALKECIRALDLDKKHTPFRQSKLTQVLKDSFVGNSRTCMIATISPNQSNSEHTLNTLRYADRVKELKNGGTGATNSNCEKDQRELITNDNINEELDDSEEELAASEDDSYSISSEDLFLNNEDFSATVDLLDTDFPHEQPHHQQQRDSQIVKLIPKRPSSNTIENNSLFYNKVPQEQIPYTNIDLDMIQEFLTFHRNEIRTTNECSKKETRYLTNVSLGLTTENKSKLPIEFIDYLGKLDDVLDTKIAAIEALKDKIRFMLEA